MLFLCSFRRFRSHPRVLPKCSRNIHFNFIQKLGGGGYTFILSQHALGFQKNNKTKNQIMGTMLVNAKPVQRAFCIQNIRGNKGKRLNPFKEVFDQKTWLRLLGRICGVSKKKVIPYAVFDIWESKDHIFDVKITIFGNFLAKFRYLRPIFLADLIYEPNFEIYGTGIVV